LELRRQLAARGEPGADLEVARSLVALAEGLHMRHDFQEAGEAAEEARGLAEAAGPSDAALAVLADSHLCLGWVSDSTHDYKESLRHSERSLEIRKSLAGANPGDAALQRELANAYFSVAEDLRQLGRRAECLKADQMAVEICEKEARAYPSDAVAQDKLAVAHHNTSVALRDMGEFKEAVSESEKAIGIEQKAIEANPVVSTYKHNQAYFRTQRAAVLRRLGRQDEVVQECREAAQTWQALADAHPTLLGYRISLASVAGMRGKALQQLGRLREAVAAYREAIDRMEKLPQRTSNGHYSTTCYYALLYGIAREKGSGLTPADAHAAGEQAMATLRRAIAAGYRNAAHMRKDTDLDSLRQRPDFENVLADLEKDIKASGK
jgi:tetratricopeptide (TPR) repeat protein